MLENVEMFLLQDNNDFSYTFAGCICALLNNCALPIPYKPILKTAYLMHDHLVAGGSKSTKRDTIVVMPGLSETDDVKWTVATNVQ